MAGDLRKKPPTPIRVDGGINALDLL